MPIRPRCRGYSTFRDLLGGVLLTADNTNYRVRTGVKADGADRPAALFELAVVRS